MSARIEPPMEKFPPETLQELFDAVEIDDVVDPVVILPDRIALDCPQDTMRRCYALCLQFWKEGVHRSALLRLVGTLLRTGDLSAAQRTEYKHIRAKYKHLRFALALYGVPHHAPKLFNTTIAIMGHLQDAFRNGRRKAVFGYALLLRGLLAKPLWKAVRWKVGALRLDSAEGFLAYRQAEIRRLKQALGQDMLTGHDFHAMRKIVSRQVSFYDTMRSIEHSEQAYRMSRFLSAINGLMGNRHDEMVEQAMARQRHYGAQAPLEDDIRQRLEALVARYPL